MTKKKVNQKISLGVKGNVKRSNLVVGNSNQVNYIINKYAKQLDTKSKDDLKRQLEEYLDWVQDSFGTIVLRGIERGGEQVVNVPLGTMYVPLQAEVQIFNSKNRLESNRYLPDVHRNQERAIIRNITLNEILSIGNRLVVTGGPGSGKTTVLLHLAWTLAASLRGSSKLARQQLGIKSRLPLPIYIPLTRYADYLRKLSDTTNAEKTSLKSYISEYLNERGTNLEALSPDFLNLLLREGNTVLLLLDGLDEVPNENERVLIRSYIEDLVAGKRNLRVVVTSRTAAYKGQSVLGRDFQHIHVLPLDQIQTERLIRQAYHSIYPKSEVKAKQQADDLLNSVYQLEQERRRRLGENIKPLVDAPIMIRMLLIVHYNDRKLPEQRADLYQKSVDVILRPDHAPDQKVTDEIEKRIGGSLSMNREMLQHLAFYMHIQGNELGREIDETKLRNILEAEPTYKPFVSELIAQTRQRGTLLEERGGLYRFIHLSFQEFLVGRYLVQNFSDSEKLVSFLEKGLCSNTWWREPILLAIGYQDINAPIQARRILHRLARLDDFDTQDLTLTMDLELASCELATIAYLECRSQSSDLGDKLLVRLKNLHARSQGQSWNPVIFSSAMDGLDRLSYVCDDLFSFIYIDSGKEPFYISKYPITNIQYERFLRTENFYNLHYWKNFPKFDESGNPISIQNSEAIDWLKSMKDKFQADVLPPFYWRDFRFGLNRRHAPVVGVSWYEANAYCKWLFKNWENLEEGKQVAKKPNLIRLPLEEEWTIAAGGKENNRFSFGEPKNIKNFLSCANTNESGIDRTTPVWMYLDGKSPNGVMDMSGNIWEWQANYRDEDHDVLALRGGSWFDDLRDARILVREYDSINRRQSHIGFRLVLVPSE